jgi:hypothetical protein
MSTGCTFTLLIKILIYFSHLTTSLQINEHPSYLLSGVYTLHSCMQGKVLRKHGAVSFGVINAMRSVVVSVASAALFCRSKVEIVSQCLTVASGVSALFVTLGAILWTLTPPAQHTHNKNARIPKNNSIYFKEE